MPQTDARSFRVLLYWGAWVLAGFWGFQFSWLPRLNGWWLVLATFLLTQGDVEPVTDTRGWLHRFTLICAAIACAMLLYGTSDWWIALLEGWHSTSNDPWVQQTVQRLWFPLIYGLSIVLAMGILRRPFLRALGSHAVVAIAVGGVVVTLWRQWPAISDPTNQSGNAFVIEATLFRAAITGLGGAAILERWPNRKSVGAEKSLVQRLWRGQMPKRWALGVVYPIVWVTSAYLLLKPPMMTVYHADGTFSAGRQLIVSVIRTVIPVVSVASVALIVLRALNRHGRRWQVWPSRLAQGFVLISAGWIISVVVGLTGFETGQDLRMSLAVLLGTAYQYRIADDGLALEFLGRITHGAGDELGRQLDSNPGIQRLTLSSIGGDLAEAVAMARVIQAHRLETGVVKECSSACTILFVAGSPRTLGPRGKLGFHRGAPTNPLIPVGSGICEYLAYGVSAEFCRRVQGVSPDTLWYPTRAELLAGHVLP